MCVVYVTFFTSSSSLFSPSSSFPAALILPHLNTDRQWSAEERERQRKKGKWRKMETFQPCMSGKGAERKLSTT